jgi:hypothetical protein
VLASNVVCLCFASVCAEGLEDDVACCDNENFLLADPPAVNDAINLTWSNDTYGSCGRSVRCSVLCWLGNQVLRRNGGVGIRVEAA